MLNGLMCGMSLCVIICMSYRVKNGPDFSVHSVCAVLRLDIGQLHIVTFSFCDITVKGFCVTESLAHCKFCADYFFEVILYGVVV